MRLRHRVFLLMIVPVVGTMLRITSFAADWPQWRGSQRDGVSREVGLLEEWAPGGPRLIWEIEDLGRGYGTVATQGEQVFLQGTVGDTSSVFCLNRSDGRRLWVSPLGTSGGDSRGGGPRGTPTVDGRHVYALSENGELACLQSENGSVVWRRNILRDFGGSNPSWLISESPTVDGDRLIVTPGGRGATLVALDKLSGRTLWKSRDLSDQAAYSSCVIADVQGIRSIMTFTDNAAVGVRASDGKLMWKYSRVANGTANVATPVFHRNKVFFSSGYGTGCALLSLQAQANEVTAKEIYFNRNMQNHHGGVILVDGYLYGFSNQGLTCIEFETGKRVWRSRSVGKGSLTYADGHLYLLSENNVVGLAQATPEGYREKGRFIIQDQGWPSWAHPVVSGGRLYIRNQGRLMTYNVKAD